MKILYDIAIGIGSSILTVGILQFISRYRIKRIYNNIIGLYHETDKNLNPNFKVEIYEVTFSMNFIYDAPELIIKFISGKPDKADWETKFKILPPVFYQLTGITRYLKNKEIKDFDFNDVGIHNIYIIPHDNYILIELTGKKHPYQPHSFIIKKAN